MRCKIAVVALMLTISCSNGGMSDRERDVELALITQLNFLAGPRVFVGSTTYFLSGFFDNECYDYFAPVGVSPNHLTPSSRGWIQTTISTAPCSTVRVTSGVGWCAREGYPPRLAGPFHVLYSEFRFYESYARCDSSCDGLSTVAEGQTCCAANCGGTWIGFE